MEILLSPDGCSVVSFDEHLTGKNQIALKNMKNHQINMSTDRNINRTRMHSSRMPTVRCSGRLLGKGVSASGGVWVSAHGVSAWGVFAHRGVSAWGSARHPPCEQNDRQV